MCGITAYFGHQNVAEYIMDALKRLEYRGYDSAGIATLSNPGIKVAKDTGNIDEIKSKVDLSGMDGEAGIGHTRWATHGGVNKENAHPHCSCDDRFAVVHNGIIENWEELKDQLGDHEFKSETDSEVITHYIEDQSNEKSVEEAIQRFLKEAEGSFAVVLLDSDDEKMYAFKRGSPLALGTGENETHLGSDIYSFSPYTNEAIFFEDNEYAVIGAEGFVFKDSNGEEIEKKPERFEWTQEESGKGEHEHHMRKEIGDIPRCLERLQTSLETSQKESLEELVEALKEHERVIFTASGTSYHASLLGVYFLNRIGLDAQTLIASEFKNYERVDEETLVVAISQSGETKDVIDAIEFSRERGADVASIVNVPYSTIERMSDINLRIEAGQEICVAATKTFVNQLYLLLSIANEMGYDAHLSKLPELVEEIIRKNEPRIKELAKELVDREDVYIIGRGLTYPVAREMALKLKEIPYVHAEGMMGGELKHGTLALIEEGTPVISLIPEKDSEIKSNVKEVEARGARTIKISPWEGEFDIPSKNSNFAFFASIIGFMLSYWIAYEKGHPIDFPKNLAKCVSVK